MYDHILSASVLLTHVCIIAMRRLPLLGFGILHKFPVLLSAMYPVIQSLSCLQVQEKYLMNFSSSGLCALIGGPCDFFADEPPIDSADRPPTVASVAIASC
jgi:hypothetical protein